MSPQAFDIGNLISQLAMIVWHNIRSLQVCQEDSRGEFGNDTIDCYPLAKGEIKKILIVSEQKFEELQKEFNLFFKGLEGRISQRPSLREAKTRQILKSQAPSKASGPKIDSEDLVGGFRDYEPTKAIHFNDCNWRRWVRVKEWFSQYAQGAEQQIF